MTNITPFVSKASLTAQQNLKRFISYSKNKLTVFNEVNGPINWDSYYWKGVVNFTKLGVHSQGHSVNDALCPDFIDFAKAYFRLQQGIKSTGTMNESKALRCIEAAFLEQAEKANICALNEDILDIAAEKARENYAKGSAYHAGRELERLAEFVTEKHISDSAIDWSSPINRDPDKNKTGKKAKADREKKLPNELALNAIAEIFSCSPEDDRDNYTTSTVAMLLAAPSRVTEVHDLPVFADDIPSEYTSYIDRSRNKATGYGWRFRAGKGYDPEIKWIPTAMQDLSKCAFNRIKTLTEPARYWAVRMESIVKEAKNGKTPLFPRHELCPDVGEFELLTRVQAATALGFEYYCNGSIISKAGTFLQSRELNIEDHTYCLSDLVPTLINKLPKDFPWYNKKRGLKYSDALFCMFNNQLSSQKQTIKTELWKPTQNTLNHQLGSRNGLDETVFDRWDFNDKQVNLLKLLSHQFRHLINTIAQRGGMKQEDIAKWSGRADPSQNPIYNHVSPEEKLNKLRELDPELKVFGGDCIFEVEKPISISEFNMLHRSKVHLTEFGFCVNDYGMSPCLKFRDCINCENEECVKGDERPLERLEVFLLKIKAVVQKDEHAVESDEIPSDDESYLRNKLTLLRTEKKVELLKSDDIEDGAVIRLANNMEITKLDRAIANRQRLGIKGSKKQKQNKELKQKTKNLKKLKNLMGGNFG
jgi:hypothetical protein